MDASAIRGSLAGIRFADVRVVDDTMSTNADVLALARAGAPEGIVVVAEHQTAGRGRLDRTWEAPAGSSLLFSVLTRPADSPHDLRVYELYLVSMALGVAAAEAAAAVTGIELRLKWPNDVVATGSDGTRKLSGILAESVIEGDTVQALVVGIGINVNWPDQFPTELAGTATALNHLAGHEVDRQQLLIDVLRRFDERYRDLELLDGRAALLRRYRELSATIGARVQVELAGETVIGDAIDVTGEGHLLVVDDCPDRPREISVGDVVHLRGG